MAKKKDEHGSLTPIGATVVVKISLATLVGSYVAGVPVIVTEQNQEELSRFVAQGIASEQ